jgi:hypothetical protein
MGRILARCAISMLLGKGALAAAGVLDIGRVILQTVTGP